MKDVVIAGGGLAGLTLAHQLKRSQSDLDILVIEKGRFPKPEKTWNITILGEFTLMWSFWKSPFRRTVRGERVVFLRGLNSDMGLAPLC